MGIVCCSLSVWVLWAMGNIDRGDIWYWYVVVYVYGCCGQQEIYRGDIWDWYIVVSCTRELLTVSVATPFRTSKTHGRSVFVSVTRPFGTSNTHDKTVQVYL